MFALATSRTAAKDDGVGKGSRVINPRTEECGLHSRPGCDVGAMAGGLIADLQDKPALAIPGEADLTFPQVDAGIWSNAV